MGFWKTLSLFIKVCVVITSCANVRANVRDEERISIKTYRMCCVLFLFVFWKKREVFYALLCLVAQ